MKYLQYTLIGLAIILYITFLILPFSIPPLDAYPGYEPPRGSLVVALGWFEAIFGGTFGWFAYPLSLAAFLFAFRENGLRSLILSGIGFLLGLQYFFVQGTSISLGSELHPIMASGYYVGQLALFVLMLGCFVSYLRWKRGSKSTNSNTVT